MDWQPFLTLWSAEWIAGYDPDRDYETGPEALSTGWLGFPPASPEAIAAAERRLGQPLPPSLREFLLVSDGWRNAGTFVERLAGAAELEWLRDTPDRSWIEAYRDAGGAEVLERGLRISLRGDSLVLFLDPADVSGDGEWAAYHLSSWSGMGPERHADLPALMRDLYAGYHALRKPPGPTRDRWDAAVEQARLDALAGAVDGPVATLTEASRFGRDRADLLLGQLRAMRGEWHGNGLDRVVLHGDYSDASMRLLEDPILAAELIPLVFALDRLQGRSNDATGKRLRSARNDDVRRLALDYEQRAAEPGFRLSFGVPDFDAAVHRIRDDLRAGIAADLAASGDTAGDTAGDAASDAAGAAARARARPVRRASVSVAGGGQARDPRARGITSRRAEAAWPALRRAFELWRPLGPNHVAPVVLFADPLLAQVIGPARGREFLLLRRG